MTPSCIASTIAPAHSTFGRACLGTYCLGPGMAAICFSPEAFPVLTLALILMHPVAIWSLLGSPRPYSLSCPLMARSSMMGLAAGHPTGVQPGLVMQSRRSTSFGALLRLFMATSPGAWGKLHRMQNILGTQLCMCSQMPLCRCMVIVSALFGRTTLGLSGLSWLLQPILQYGVAFARQVTL